MTSSKTATTVFTVRDCLPSVEAIALQQHDVHNATFDCYPDLKLLPIGDFHMCTASQIARKNGQEKVDPF